MQFKNVSILSLEHVDAPHRITSAEMSAQLAPTLERLGMPLDLLESASGIAARRYWDKDVQPSEVAAQAAEKAINESGVDRSEIRNYR